MTVIFKLVRLCIAKLRPTLATAVVASAACQFVGSQPTQAQIPGDSLVLEGNFIQTGVSNNGTLGVGGGTNPGFIFDSTGTGTFNPANDYLTPGTPWEGFSLSYAGSGGAIQNNNTGTTQIGSTAAPTVVPSATSGFDQSIHWSGTIAGTLTIEHLYGLDEGSKQVEITTTISALTDLSDLKFSRYIDPDSGGTNSINTRGNATLGLAPEDWVNSESEANGATLGLYTDSDVTHNTAISPGWSINPDDYLAGSADTIGDHTIGIAFDIGTLLTGQSITLAYIYAVAADVNDFDLSGSFASLAHTPNQLAVANYLDALRSGATGDLETLITDLSALTDDELRLALDQLSGAFYGSLPAASFQHSSYYLSKLASQLRGRMVPFRPGSGAFAQAPVGPSFEIEDGEIVLVGNHSCCCCPQRGGWIAGYGLGGNADDDGNADGFRYGLGGTQFAVEEQVTCNTTLGTWYNFAWNTLEGDNLDETAQIENYHFGGYLVSFDGVQYAILLGGLGYDEYETRRDIGIGGTARANFDGWQANAYLERGLSLGHRGWVFQPYGALQYIYLHQDEFTEQGAGLLNLDVDELDAHSLRSILGARASLAAGFGGRSPLSPEFRAAWIHEFLDDDRTITGGFATVGAPGFAVRGVDLGRDWALLGTGLNLRLTPSARLFAGYDVQFNEFQVFHVGSGGAEFVW